MLSSTDARIPRTIEDLVPPALAARLDRLDLASRSVLAGKLPGERRSKRKGRSVEFDDFRQYLPGDDLRHIDWNVLARLDRLVVKLFRQDEDLSLHLLIDTSASMDAGSPTKRLFGVRLAMALGYIGLVNQNRVRCTRFSPDPFSAPSASPTTLAGLRGRRSAQRLCQFMLDSFNPPSTAPAGPPPRAAADSLRVALRSAVQGGVIVLISDFLFPEGISSSLDVLAAAGGSTRDTWAIQVLSPAELDPEVERASLQGDVRLIDSETGLGAEVTVSRALIQRYRQRLNTLSTEFKSACAARGIASVQVSSESDVGDLVLGSLRRGGLLR